MATTVPHLSLEGFITNKKIIMIKLMEHFLASDYSQSNMFMDEVCSLKYILEQYRTADELKRNMISTLYRMYSKHYQTVDIMIDITDSDDSSVQKINIDILAVDFYGNQHSLNRSLSELDGKILNFDELEMEINDE